MATKRTKKVRKKTGRRAAAGRKSAAAPKRSASRKGVASKPRASAARSGGAGVEFNHAMIYSSMLARALLFYRDLLGFTVVDSYPGAYARLKSPGGGTTLALHCLEEGQLMNPKSEGVRLYFEVKGLDALCKTLEGQGVVFDQGPRDMPWGWRHAYLRDPDGHEISLYWAGPARLRKTVMNREPH